MSSFYQLFLAGMSQASRPIGTLLFLGPTGSGKTRVVEAAAEVLFGNPNADRLNSVILFSSIWTIAVATLCSRNAPVEL